MADTQNLETAVQAEEQQKEKQQNIEYLTLDITYNIPQDKFVLGGTVDPKKAHSILEAFLYLQMGDGVDSRKAVEQEEYHINIRWYPHRDRFQCYSDTGNRGLRDGILMHILGKIYKEK
jgi:DNA-dependent RNA polymerase auxiliary subunit epsilon